MFEVQATMNFRDMVENKMRHRGDVWTVHTMERVQELLSAGPGKKGVINIISAKKRQSNKYEGPKIIISQSHLYYIGGIETFVINFTKHYKDRNITLLSSIMDNKTILIMSEYCDVIKDELNNYECDVLLLGNYDCEGVLPRIKSKKVYQMIHGDLRGLKKYLPGGERGFKWQKHPRVDKIISVSQSAADGLMEVSKYDSEVIYNILDDEPLDDMKVFITLSRATAEKGIGRMIKMAEAFRKAGKHFIWYICCSLEQAPREYVYKIKSQTGESIPSELIQRLVDASNFNVAYACLRQLSFGLLDMAWYTRTTPFDGDVRTYEKEAWKKAQVLPDIEETCMTVQFSHIMAGGYSAGYYSYKWAEVLDADAFSLFKEKGIFNKETANSFRENVLSKGGTEHPMVLYKNFRGKEPNINALLERNGIKTGI